MRLLLLCFILSLSGCAYQHKNTELTSANRIIEKTVSVSPPQPAMKYQLVKGANPALEKAYQHYMKTGIAKTIETDQFVQFPYDASSQPLVAASIFELTVISLEAGERVSSVSCGDPTRWSYSLTYSGSDPSRQAHIMVKPTKINISSDLFITTDRRAYYLKLFSSDNSQYVREIRFWYPQIIQDTLAQDFYDQQHRQEMTVSEVDLNHLNFSYQIKTKRPSPDWLPHNVFDDGAHTYIQFSKQVHSSDLPVLLVQANGQQEIVNYRYKSPYFVVDKIFSSAILIAGTGAFQQRVTIVNLSKTGH